MTPRTAAVRSRRRRGRAYAASGARRRLGGPSLGLLAVAIAVTAAVVSAASGCTAELTPRPGVGAADPGGDIDPEAQALFLDTVQPLLHADRPSGACALCHQADQAGFGPDFMGATLDDNYTALQSSSRLISPATPDASLLVTRGAHAGDALPADERAIVEAWIAIE